ncbi:hypothetical protein CUMW_261810 [Citrus unshiu]|uniref:U6 snRNA-associated Sm-like protein LSm8 n=1 Tax=Citrus unshiu TaxID=55188 RepID=A0A2H5QU77_CITUN|nr:hypothetical protein CUMW_261810 [Citrus unshiu]
MTEWLKLCAYELSVSLTSKYQLSQMTDGVLKGFDQATNIILDESHERVYSTKEGVQQLVLGLYIIRGDNMTSYRTLGQD